MRAGTALGIAVLIAATAAGPRRVVATDLGGRPLAVAYTNEAALRRAVAVAHGRVVRVVAPLHVAQVDGTEASALRGLSGIGAVQPAARRFAAVAPPLGGLAAPAPEWQYRATHADAVPDAVLRSAAAVTIAVVDTGADLSAPDLAAKSPATWNTRTGGGDVRDSNGHGTFVASLAAGSVTNGEGIAGAGGDAQLLVIKSGSDGGSFTDIDEAAGITYAVDHGARIVNLSVGGPTTSATERRAIAYAVEHGALVVAPVGNDREPRNPVEYPAALLQPVGSNGAGGAGLAVTAAGPDGRRVPFANTGSWVSLAAPGDRVFGAVSAASSSLRYPRTPLAGSPEGLYGYASGTSFAAPQVAGAAALVWAANPSLTAEQVAQVLKETATGSGRWTPDLGFGVIDVAAAVARAQAGRTGVLLGGLRDKGRVRLSWSGDAAAYTLDVLRDGRVPQTVLAATRQTKTTYALAKGHVYSFTVSALDAAGATTATSSPLTFVVRP